MQNNKTQLNQDANLGLVAIYVSTLLISLNGLFAKLIPLDATTITQLRSAVAFVVVFFVSLALGKSIRLKNSKQLISVLILGVILGLHWITFFAAMQVSTVAIGILSLYTYPLVTVLIEPLFLKGRPFKKDIMAAFVIIFGMFIMVSGGSESLPQSKILLGIFLGVFSAVLYSLRNIASRYLFDDVPSGNLMLYQTLIIALCVLPFIDFSAVSQVSANVWFWIAALGIVNTAGAHTLITYGLKKLPVKTVAIIGCMQPALAAICAYFVMNEVPSIPVIIGGIIILSVAIYETVSD